MKYYSVTKTHRLPGAFSYRKANPVTKFYIRFEDVPERDRAAAVEHETESVQFPFPAFEFCHQKFDRNDNPTRVFVNNYTDEEFTLS